MVYRKKKHMSNVLILHGWIIIKGGVVFKFIYNSCIGMISRLILKAPFI
jgi:hypothetical protein